MTQAHPEAAVLQPVTEELACAACADSPVPLPVPVEAVSEAASREPEAVVVEDCPVTVGDLLRPVIDL